MSLSRTFIFTVFFAAGLPGSQAAALADKLPAPLSIAICDDGNEWPPYSYFTRVNGKKTEQLAGYAVDVIREIFDRHHVQYSIELIPWARCQAVAELGKDYGMVLNMSHSRSRASQFYLSRPYYLTTTFYFYSRKNHPDGLAISSAADLRKYRMCGVQGYNYEGLGVDERKIDQGAKDFVALISKIKLGRCVLFLEKGEVMAGFAAIGKDYLAGQEIAKVPLPGVKPVPFHFGVSKRHPHGQQVRALIDADLRRMEASGRLDELLKKSQRALAREP